MRITKKEQWKGGKRTENRKDASKSKETYQASFVRNTGNPLVIIAKKILECSYNRLDGLALGVKEPAGNEGNDVGGMRRAHQRCERK